VVEMSLDDYVCGRTAKAVDEVDFLSVITNGMGRTAYEFSILRLKSMGTYG
jgi:hypothetical protein